jgi:hypothetical protein
MIRISPIILLLLLILNGCATLGPVTMTGIRTDLESVSRKISANRSFMDSLRDRRIGKTGYYYVLDTDGKVVFHPRTALIGSSFSKIWFIDQLLAEKSGCLTYTLGNRTHYLIFIPLDDSEILCLSITSEDLSGLVECKTAQVKPAD